MIADRRIPSDRPDAGGGSIRGQETWRAFAKINDELRVLGRRADGDHEVRTVFQTIDLADEIRVVPASGFRFTASSGPADETNLVVRAVRAFEKATGIDVRLDIRLIKKVPSGGGLGGGSADAAVTVMGLRRAYAPGLPAERVHSILASIGADVPFFALGGCALGAGRGEILFPMDVGEAAEGENEQWYVLVHPGVEIRTAEAYGWLDEFRSGDRWPGDRWPGAAPHSQLTEIHEYTTILGFCARFAPHLGVTEPGPASCLNDFELALFQRFPELAEIKRRLLAEGAVVAAVSGSGATLFGRFSDRARAREAADALGREHNVSLVRPLGRREYFSRIFEK